MFVKKRRNGGGEIEEEEKLIIVKQRFNPTINRSNRFVCSIPFYHLFDSLSSLFFHIIIIIIITRSHNINPFFIISIIIQTNNHFPFTLSPYNKALHPPSSRSTHHSLLPFPPTAIIPPITPHNRTTKLQNSFRSSRITCSNGEIRYLKNNPGSTSAVPDGSTVTTLSVSYTEIYDTVPANSPLRSNGSPPRRAHKSRGESRSGTRATSLHGSFRRFGTLIGQKSPPIQRVFHARNVFPERKTACRRARNAYCSMKCEDLSLEMISAS